jgi:hypothetical protein
VGSENGDGLVVFVGLCCESDGRPVEEELKVWVKGGNKSPGLPWNASIPSLSVGGKQIVGLDAPSALVVAGHD